MTNDTATPTPDALRAQLVDALTSKGSIRSTAVRDAFATVPRHAFLPDRPVEEAYANQYVVTHHRDGADISSASQPDVVAMMLEQLDVRPGMRVLEIGAGTGYNAALLNELVGPEGAVVTIDIEPDVTAAARTHLDATGHGRVRVITGDGALGAPAEEEPFDRVIATTGVWDIPPAWWDQLAADGRMVVPLRWRGLTRSLALTPVDGRLEARDVRLCGFIPMQGQEGEKSAALADGVTFHFDQDAPIDAAALPKVLNAARAEAWSRVRITGETPLEGVWMSLARALPGTGRMVTKPLALGSDLVTPATPACPAVAEAGSLGYLSVRRVSGEEPRLELGAIGHGPLGAALAQRICDRIAVWDGARDAVPHVAVYRVGGVEDEAAAVKEHCAVVVC